MMIMNEFKNLLIKNTIYEDDNQNKVTFIFVNVLKQIVNDITNIIDNLIIAQKKNLQQFYKNHLLKIT